MCRPPHLTQQCRLLAAAAVPVWHSAMWPGGPPASFPVSISPPSPTSPRRNPTRPLQFCLLEPELLCRLVFVRDVECQQAGGEQQGTQQAQQGPRAPPGTTELPTCPVCLERLDEHISGIVTTVSLLPACWRAAFCCVGRRRRRTATANQSPPKCCCGPLQLGCRCSAALFCAESTSRMETRRLSGIADSVCTESVRYLRPGASGHQYSQACL